MMILALARAIAAMPGRPAGTAGPAAAGGPRAPRAGAPGRTGPAPATAAPLARLDRGTSLNSPALGLVLGGAGLGEAVGAGAGFDDVAAEGEAVDSGGGYLYSTWRQGRPARDCLLWNGVHDVVIRRSAAISRRWIHAAASPDPGGVSDRLSRPCTATAGSTRRRPSVGPYAVITSSHWANSTDDGVRGSPAGHYQPQQPGPPPTRSSLASSNENSPPAPPLHMGRRLV